MRACASPKCCWNSPLARTGVERREIRLLIVEDFLVNIQRAARRAHRYRRHFRDEQRRQPAVIHGIGMQRVARLIADRAALAIEKPERTIRGDERIFDHHAARAGALHPDHVPVVDDFELIAIKEYPGVAERGFGFGIVHHCGAEEMRGEVAAGSVVPGAFHAIAAIAGNANAAGHADAGSAHIARGAEDFALSAFGQLRRENRVAGSEREHPGAFRAASRDRDHDPNEIGQREFVAAEKSRLQDAIEAGSKESIVGVFGQLARLFALGLAFAQQRTQSFGAAEEFVDSEVGLGW